MASFFVVESLKRVTNSFEKVEKVDSPPSTPLIKRAFSGAPWKWVLKIPINRHAVILMTKVAQGNFCLLKALFNCIVASIRITAPVAVPIPI